MVLNTGYGRREIANAAAEQITRLAAYSGFAFLGSGGSDAIDTAAKLVRCYWDVIGRPEEAHHR